MQLCKVIGPDLKRQITDTSFSSQSPTRVVETSQMDGGEHAGSSAYSLGDIICMFRFEEGTVFRMSSAG